MTDRLYYRDARLQSFEAMVARCDTVDGQARVVLDRTAFYPTSGGQPFDRGRLGDVYVIDVVDGPEGDVVHITSGPLVAGTHVTGVIDWPRRFDHTQQHTGQHVLSAAFERASGIRTVSFHLGTELSTIDLHREASASEIAAAEELANQVVWEDRPVSVHMVDASEAARLPLRKETERSGTVRLVDIEDFDLSACGGTHVSRTGAVGIIAVTGSERFKGGTRIAFACGGRALASHRRLRDIAADAGRLLSVGPGEIGAQIERLRQEARARQKRCDELAGQLLTHRAAEWRNQAETIGPLQCVIRHEASADVTTLKAMAQAIVDGGTSLVAVLAGGGEPTPVVAARSAGVSFDARAFVASVTATFGGRGGGRPELAQGGVTADAERIFAHFRTSYS